MKKSGIILFALVSALASCNKEDSKSSESEFGSATKPMLVSVVNSSNSVALNETSYPASDSIPVDFHQASDTTLWWICNPASGSSDSSIYPGDTSSIPVNIAPPVVSAPPTPPADSTGNPGDTIATVYPPTPPAPPSPIVIQPSLPADSTSNPADTSRGVNLVFYSALQSNPRNYACSIAGNGSLNLKIYNTGEYQILVGTYRRNTDGSFTLVKTGFISFSAK
jgi:hypothetical protein